MVRRRRIGEERGKLIKREIRKWEKGRKERGMIKSMAEDKVTGITKSLCKRFM